MGYLRIDRDREFRLFEDTLTNFKIKSTLQQMAHDYYLDTYIRNIEDELSQSPDSILNSNPHSEFVLGIIESKVRTSLSQSIMVRNPSQSSSTSEHIM